MSKRDKLTEMLQTDPFGLLKSKSNKAPLTIAESKLVKSFEEILDFFELHNSEPKSNISDISEFRLYSRLRAIRSDPGKVKTLKKYDFVGLLEGKEIREITLEELLSDDPLGLLNTDIESSIYELKHVSPTERISPQYLSRRRVCKEFPSYEEMFLALHADLESKKRRLVRYNSKDLNVGGFYVLSGILLYLKSIDGKLAKTEFRSGERERFDGRTVCIFENGTQSDMLFRSLNKAMYLDGYSISEILDSKSLSSDVEEQDVQNGYIYILRSKNRQVKDIPNLYKIGHTSGLVTQRIKNAKAQSTYLFDEVEIVSAFRCINIGSMSLEKKIHDFFELVRLDIELIDAQGNTYGPKEWFQVELKTIEEAITFILNDEIQSYYFDDRVQQIVKK